MRGIKVGEHGDWMILNGSVEISEVSEQVTQRVLLAVPGEIKEMPTRGVGLCRYLGATADPFLEGTIRSQLTAEGVVVGTIDITSEGVNIEIKN